MNKGTTRVDDLGEYDEWTEEAFEEHVSSALISLYESRLTGQKKNHPSQRITDAMLQTVRKQGVYIPNGNRLIYGDFFDTLYPFPDKATLSIDRSDYKEKPNATIRNAYRQNLYVERIEHLPKGYTRTGGGVLYRVVSMVAVKEGAVDGGLHYMSIDKEGKAHPCDVMIHNSSQLLYEPEHINNMVLSGLVTLNYWADKYNVWTIEAQESEARCLVGVDKEQVKSLLYARSLPLTTTGRKRPILHLVAAHRRRLKEGIEIEIDEFLRGVTKVEMNGTVFTVGAPEKFLKEKRLTA